jgi:tryptophan synthase beta chain
MVNNLKNIIINKDGYFGSYGGRFVPEVIVPIVDELNETFFEAIEDKNFLEELAFYQKHFIGRPSPLLKLDNLTKELGGAEIYLKNEGLNHTGAHKINHVIGQVLLAKRIGKQRIIAETGAGQHGLATATACAKFGLDCTVYMGKKDYLRQRPNVFYMELLGAKVIAVEEGDQTLKSAVTASFKDLIGNPYDTHYLLGTACGPRPYPAMNVYFQKIIGEEIRKQLNGNPDYMIACVGGGSNSLGFFYEFLDDLETDLIAVEAGGVGKELGEHAARFQGGSVGIFEGYRSYFLFNEESNIGSTHSISAGLDYCGISPQLAYLHDEKRVQFVDKSDKSVLAAVEILAKKEGIIPALESAHAVAYALDLAPKLDRSKKLVINCSGRGDKDLFINMPEFQLEKYQEFLKYEFKRTETQVS